MHQEPQSGLGNSLLIHQQGQTEDAEDYLQYLLFSIMDRHYGIDILDIHEILKPVPLTRLPNVRSDVLGVINLRGNIIPVMDLQKKFFGTYTELAEDSRIIVASNRRKNTGLLVAGIKEVARIREEQMEAAQMEHVSEEHIKGAARSKDKVFLVINLDALFQNMQA